jgi:hypothetical protein
MITIGMPAAVLLLAASALAQAPVAELTLSDIAACNEQAAARTSGAALPRPEGPRPVEGKAPIVEGERDLPKRAGSEKSDPTGSIVTDSPDPLAKGMDAQRASDPAYRAAYRECLQERGARKR